MSILVLLSEWYEAAEDRFHVSPKSGFHLDFRRKYDRKANLTL